MFGCLATAGSAGSGRALRQAGETGPAGGPPLHQLGLLKLRPGPAGQAVTVLQPVTFST